jgi:hypothetical protein
MSDRRCRNPRQNTDGKYHICSRNIPRPPPFKRKENEMCPRCTKEIRKELKSKSAEATRDADLLGKRLLHDAENDRAREIAEAKANAKAKAEESK